MAINSQSPFDPFHIDSPRDEVSWLASREAIRPKQRKGLWPDAFRRRFRHRWVIGAATTIAVVAGALGFGHLWFAIP